jgi:hypothetical protein
VKVKSLYQIRIPLITCRATRKRDSWCQKWSDLNDCWNEDPFDRNGGHGTLKAMKEIIDPSLSEMSANMKSIQETMKSNQEDLLPRLEAKIVTNRETD